MWDTKSLIPQFLLWRSLFGRKGDGGCLRGRASYFDVGALCTRIP